MSDVATVTEAATEAPAVPPAPAPHPTLESLRPMVGTWHLETRDLAPDAGWKSGGTLRRRFMSGGFYLVEDVETGGGEHEAEGRQYVGYDPVNGNLKGSYYSSEGPGPFGLVALEYVWQVIGRDVTIWCGAAGSPARFTGSLSEDGNTIRGRWEWPGGGYEAVETRVG